MDKSAGKLFRAGINFATNSKDPHTATLALQTLVTFRYRNQDSSEGSDVTVLDPTTYDNAGRDREPVHAPINPADLTSPVDGPVGETHYTAV